MKILGTLNSLSRLVSNITMALLAISATLMMVFIITQTYYYECVDMLIASHYIALILIAGEVTGIITEHLLNKFKGRRV